MRVSEIGLKHLAEFEGTVLSLYNDQPGPAGNCTIGTGHLVHLGNCDGRDSERPYRYGITKAKALELLEFDVWRFEDCVENAVKVPLTQHQFDALVSLAFNVGCGGLQNSYVLHEVNNGWDPLSWVSFAITGVGSPTILPGLVRRRRAEYDLYHRVYELEGEDDMTFIALAIWGDRPAKIKYRTYALFYGIHGPMKKQIKNGFEREALEHALKGNVLDKVIRRLSLRDLKQYKTLEGGEEPDQK